ncbi:MAG TPA: AAA family ATPase [Candidatus Binatia bacterium]|jgi:general secretion pathway protein A
MYNEFFGLSESPFNITPNARFFYRTPSCDEALRTVRHAIEARKGVIVITGEPGTGKTLFLKSLARDMDPRVRTVIVYNPHTDLNGLLRLLLDRLDLHATADDRTAMFHRLTDFLIEQRRYNCTICLLIDEAQELDEKTLDELRLLSNLDFEDEALLPVVLLGQPELHMKLDQPSARRIKQRVALTRHTYPLVRMEIGPYIRSRLEVANYKGADLFGPRALEKIAAYSGGIPRMVNSICDNSLIRAYTAKRSVISPEIIDQVAREMHISAPLSLQIQPWPSGLTEMRSESTSFADDAESVIDEVVGSPTAKQVEESSDLENSEATAVHPYRTESMAPRQLGTTEAIQGSPDNEASSNLDTEVPLEQDPASRANVVGSYALNARPGIRRAPVPWRVRWPSIRHVCVNFRLYWYAVAAVIGLLMLAFGINVSFSQLASIYSAASTAKPATGIHPPSSQYDKSQAAQNVEHTRALAAPAPSNSAFLAHRQKDTATVQADSGIAPNYANGKKPGSMNAAPPPLPRNGEPRRAQPANSPGKPNENGRKDTATTIKVVAASLVRNKPTAGAEIISTLEPGSRVTVVAMSRDYYQVRSVDKQSIRGYVHREDAFFERRK